MGGRNERGKGGERDGGREERGVEREERGVGGEKRGMEEGWRGKDARMEVEGRWERMGLATNTVSCAIVTSQGVHLF